jgi:hypothetical protein
MTKRTKLVLAAGAAALALAGVGGGVAFASGGTSGTSTAPASSAAATAGTTPAHPHRPRALLSRVEHGEVTVATKKGDQVIDVQRGQVTAVNPTSVTVRSADGFTGTYTVAGSSKIRVNRQASSITDVHDGDRVALTALRSGGTATVRGLTDSGAPR